MEIDGGIDGIFYMGADTTILFVSQLFFNIFFYYLIFCAFILLFIMIGVILLLNLTTDITANFSVQNKILQNSSDHILVGRVIQQTNNDLQRK
jgi:hypothetical protein